MKDALAWTEYCKSLAPAVVETCARTTVSAGPAALVKELARSIPDWKFRHAFSRGGWYRLGGVVGGDGSRISDHLESWAEAALEGQGGDLGDLADTWAAQDLHATRLTGQTHYLVASAGAGSTDFIQLEIEGLQEMVSHPLGVGDLHPASLEDLIDPPDRRESPRPLGLPFYSFRRLQHVGAFLGRMLAQKPEPAPIHRLVADWGASSAGHASALYNHWVIATREHLDRYRQPAFRAQPIATFPGLPPDFAAAPGTSGLKLQAALTAFDREVGYPMAWYFHLLTGKAVPHWVAQAVVEDALGGFAYLPQRDIDVVRGWLHRPYAV